VEVETLSQLEITVFRCTCIATITRYELVCGTLEFISIRFACMRLQSRLKDFKRTFASYESTTRDVTIARYCARQDAAQKRGIRYLNDGYDKTDFPRYSFNLMRRRRCRRLCKIQLMQNAYVSGIHILLLACNASCVQPGFEVYRGRPVLQQPSVVKGHCDIARARARALIPPLFLFSCSLRMRTSGIANKLLFSGIRCAIARSRIPRRAEGSE